MSATEATCILALNLTGTDEATLSVAQTVINTASKREKALAFHYASEALNNSFFLDFLVCPPQIVICTHPLTCWTFRNLPHLPQLRTTKMRSRLISGLPSVIMKVLLAN